jgi:hypothetical protein
MMRMSDTAVEYLVLGDSTIVIDVTGQDLLVVSDRRIDKVAASEQREMMTLLTGTPGHQAARIRFVNLQREMRNRPDGYPIASADPGAASAALTGTIPRSGLRRISLLSDGVTRFTEFDLGTWGELQALLDLYGGPTVFARIREAETGDPAGRRWPRAKRHDDAAVVHFTTRQRTAWGRLDVASWTGRALGALRKTG